VRRATEHAKEGGGGRKPLVVTDPELLSDLMALVEPGERGDPQRGRRDGHDGQDNAPRRHSSAMVLASCSG
jgi:hypothetical protein